MEDLTKLYLEVLLAWSTGWMYALTFVPILHALSEHRTLLKLELCKVVLYTFNLYLNDYITDSGLFLTQIGCDVREIQVNPSAGILVQ